MIFNELRWEKFENGAWDVGVQNVAYEKDTEMSDMNVLVKAMWDLSASLQS